ncbi:MAG TPA: TrbI/VirB10 family protein [Stellaceae bacterium]|nr:TrbI/VirB10 family protein [Stellaceae bacterium]
MAENMEGPEGAKVDPETLVLRARPRRVVRFKRRLMIGVAAVGALALMGAAWLALSGPAFRPRQSGPELLDQGRKPMPDGLSSLPGSYDQVAKPAPQLGPPLPGDLGPPVVRQERTLGVPPQPVAPVVSLRPDPEEEEARANRIRLAQQRRQAREASVLFQLPRTDRGSATAVAPAGSTTGQGIAPTPVAAAGADRIALDPDRDQNNQQRKLDFLKQPPDQGVYNPHVLQQPASPYEVMAGTVIAASLLTGLRSDLPGFVVAQVTENVYDTVTGQILLIPQGARLIGSYDSVVAFGQKRALLVWQRIVFPDGSSIVLDNLPATDAAGYAGLEDEVDFHTWQLLKGVALSTLLGVGTQLTLGSQESDLLRALRESTQQSVNQAGQRMTEKSLNIQPTITIRPGWPLRVIVHKDLVLRPYRG